MATVSSIDPRTGRVTEEIDETPPGDVDRICRAAADSSRVLRDLGRAGRARLLRRMASSLESAREDIVALADRETGLGSGRLSGELTRTCYQLRLFAEIVEDGGYLEATIDHAGDTPMGPRPDLRRMLVPLGPVAVFGASNFPLAFSVPGGDTASAFAAGCPVVVKAHPAHPATSNLCHARLSDAVRDSGLPEDVLRLVHGTEAGATLVQHPSITAVGFTGSASGGGALRRLIEQRSEPIPFFGELSSLNPVMVTHAAAHERAEEIASGLAGSYLLGSGQFCTKPGLVFVPSGEAGDRLVRATADAVRESAPQQLLTEGVRRDFDLGTRRLRESADVLATGQDGSETDGFTASPLLVQCALDAIGPELLDEVFGPATVIVRYDDTAGLNEVLARVPGSLTATIHCGETESADLSELTAVLQERAGRVLYQGWPTGVAVSWAQHHGGPWPSTSSQHTSVGATSIRRFLRPVVFQNAPESVLPAELREAYDEIPRRVDGTLTLPGHSAGAQKG